MFRLTSCILSLLAFGKLAVANHGENYHQLNPLGIDPHMWVFGAEGVQIYSPDGSEMISQVTPDKACHTVSRDGGVTFSLRCDWYDVVSDGKKYVWASVARGSTKINVFSIKTGGLIGSFDTCSSFYDMSYNPLREEMWVHCGGFSEKVQTHMDVFSTIAPSAPVTSSVVFHNNTAYRTYGRLATNPEMGDYGLATVYGDTNLYMVDLAGREVEKAMDLKGNRTDFAKLHGLYDLAYSGKNNHAFIRSQVCCTCGFDGADAIECGRYGAGNITVDGALVRGQCGHHCEGGSTDTIGVIEFDTISQSVVGTHPLIGSSAVDSAFTSPDGESIIFFGMDGGKTVQIYEAGANGVKSMLKHDIPLDFNVTNVEDDPVYSDHAFVKTTIGDVDIDLLVLSSSNEHKVALIDFSSDIPAVTYVTFKDELKTDRARTRQIEWVDGTEFVWISGPREIADNIFIIDLLKGEHVKTMSINDPRKFVSVINYDLLGLTETIERSMEAAEVDDTMAPTGTPMIKCEDGKGRFDYYRATYKAKNNELKSYKNWDKRNNKKCKIFSKEKDMVTIDKACEDEEIKERCVKTCGGCQKQ